LNLEQEACRRWLNNQIELVQPEIIICLGRVAAMGMIRPDFRITKEHGQWFRINGRDYMAIYHPSALLRDVSKRPETFVDLRTIRERLRELYPQIFEENGHD